MVKRSEITLPKWYIKILCGNLKVRKSARPLIEWYLRILKKI